MNMKILLTLLITIISIAVLGFFWIVHGLRREAILNNVDRLFSGVVERAIFEEHEGNPSAEYFLNYYEGDGFWRSIRELYAERPEGENCYFAPAFSNLRQGEGRVSASIGVPPGVVFVFFTAQIDGIGEYFRNPDELLADLGDRFPAMPSAASSDLRHDFSVVKDYFYPDQDFRWSMHDCGDYRYIRFER